MYAPWIPGPLRLSEVILCDDRLMIEIVQLYHKRAQYNFDSCLLFSSSRMTSFCISLDHTFQPAYGSTVQSGEFPFPIVRRAVAYLPTYWIREWKSVKCFNSIQSSTKLPLAICDTSLGLLFIFNNSFFVTYKNKMAAPLSPMKGML